MILPKNLIERLEKLGFSPKEAQVGIIIQNQHIADTQKAIFKLTFNYLKNK